MRLMYECLLRGICGDVLLKWQLVEVLAQRFRLYVADRTKEAAERGVAGGPQVLAQRFT
jgi:hypothetical protein